MGRNRVTYVVEALENRILSAAGGLGPDEGEIGNVRICLGEGVVRVVGGEVLEDGVDGEGGVLNAGDPTLLGDLCGIGATACEDVRFGDGDACVL